MAKANATAERLYIVNLRNGFIDSPNRKRGRAAMKYLKGYFEKNLKKEGVEIKISQGVNHEILKNGIKNPLNKVKVKVSISGETASVMLPDEKAPKKKKLRKISKSMDTKSKLQEMLSQKTAAAPAKTEEKKTDDIKAPKKAVIPSEKEESADKKFEEQVQADKKPAGKK